tara:strand:- start:429 stop:1625 length:1197 start_codon:yes stop_codon:yes gene_type:complete
MTPDKAEVSAEGSVVTLPNGNDSGAVMTAQAVWTLVKLCFDALLSGAKALPVTIAYGKTGSKWQGVALIADGETSIDSDSDFIVGAKALLAATGNSGMFCNDKGNPIGGLRPSALVKALESVKKNWHKMGQTGLASVIGSWHIYGPAPTQSVTDEIDDLDFDFGDDTTPADTDSLDFDFSDTPSQSIVEKAMAVTMAAFEWILSFKSIVTWNNNVTFGKAVGQSDINPTNVKTMHIVKVKANGERKQTDYDSANPKHSGAWKADNCIKMGNFNAAVEVGVVVGAKARKQGGKDWLTLIQDRTAQAKLQNMALQLLANCGHGVSYNGAPVNGYIGQTMGSDCDNVKQFIGMMDKHGVEMRGKTGVENRRGTDHYTAPTRDYTSSGTTDLSDEQVIDFSL